MTAALIDDRFELARAHAAQGKLVVVRVDGECLLLPALARDTVNPQMVAAVERIVPSTSKRNVAVMSDTSWATNAPPSLQAANQAIPFFGMLIGLASLGHTVWVFQGAANLFIAGCRGADVLIVDSASIAELPGNWQAEAEQVMRSPEILIHDRATYKLLVLGRPSTR
jgi:hypothetical protein